MHAGSNDSWPSCSLSCGLETQPRSARSEYEGLRCKKRLWRDAGRQQLESFLLAPWRVQSTQQLQQIASPPACRIESPEPNTRG